jgi:hypothetical protein
VSFAKLYLAGRRCSFRFEKLKYSVERLDRKKKRARAVLQRIVALERGFKHLTKRTAVTARRRS